MVEAIGKEIALKGTRSEKEKISTIYFGGGTPSILPERDVEELVKTIRSHFDLSEIKEFTFELNPEHASKSYLNAIIEIGIDRISLGIQTFSDKALVKLNRGHNNKMALEAIENIKMLGLKNFNLDLIFGLPFVNANSFQRDLDRLIEINPPHISAYSLTIEPKTKFGNDWKKGVIQISRDEDYWSQFLHTHNSLTKKKYSHYEISNYCKPGFESVHNQNYWREKPYIGIGPSSHSFNGNFRSWNISSNHKYIMALKENTIPEESEKRDQLMMANERILTSLRTSRGLNLNSFEKEFQTDLRKSAAKFFEAPLNNDLWNIKDKWLNLTLKGWFQSDDIISQLFLDRLT